MYTPVAFGSSSTTADLLLARAMALRVSAKALGCRSARRFAVAAGFRTFLSGSEATVGGLPVRVFNEGGTSRVLVTKPLPGQRWLDILQAAGCRVEICTSDKTILDPNDIAGLIGSRCDGVVGQLTEEWNATLFNALKAAGGRAFSNCAVGYNNGKVDDATAVGIPVRFYLSAIPSAPQASWPTVGCSTASYVVQRNQLSKPPSSPLLLLMIQLSFASGRKHSGSAH